jgi:hypothetical protein
MKSTKIDNQHHPQESRQEIARDDGQDGTRNERYTGLNFSRRIDAYMQPCMQNAKSRGTYSEQGDTCGCMEGIAVLRRGKGRINFSFHVLPVPVMFHCSKVAFSKHLRCLNNVAWHEPG